MDCRRLNLRRLGVVVAAGTLLLAALPADAALKDAFKQIGELENQIVDRVNAVVTGGALANFAAKLFAVFALVLFMLKAMGWALRGFRLDEMVETMVRIMLTGFMLASFTVIVPACFNATLYVGNALLAGITGVGNGSPQSLTMPTALVDTLVTYGLHVSPNCHLGWNPLNLLDCIKGGAVAIVAALVMSLVLGLLCVAIMLVDVWGFWLYGIALAVGPVLVPFTLYDRLAFLFEGWLRFFFGTVIYVILARVNLALVAVAILTYWGSTPQALGTFTPPTLAPIEDITNILGLMLFAGVGIFTLLATGRFANAVVAGAAAGGLNFGRAAKAITRYVSSSGGSARRGASGTRGRGQQRGNGDGRRRNGNTGRGDRGERGNRGERDRRDDRRPAPALVRVPQLVAMPIGAAVAGLSMGYTAARNRWSRNRRDFGDTLPDPDNVDTVPGSP